MSHLTDEKLRHRVTCPRNSNKMVKSWDSAGVSDPLPHPSSGKEIPPSQASARGLYVTGINCNARAQGQRRAEGEVRGAWLVKTKQAPLVFRFEIFLMVLNQVG